MRSLFQVGQWTKQENNVTLNITKNTRYVATLIRLRCRLGDLINNVMDIIRDALADSNEDESSLDPNAVTLDQLIWKLGCFDC